MITAPLWFGSGLGNQLFRYVMCRVLALDKGYDFGIEYPERFKGASFMGLDMGKPVLNGVAHEGGDPLLLPDGIEHFYREKKIIDNGIESYDYDWELLKVKDKTKIDGEFQGPKYWEHRKGEIDQWLRVQHIKLPNDLCVINFRGGEFQHIKSLFLTKEYWDLGIEKMKSINPAMKFEVHTDDFLLAMRFFPGLKVIHDIGINWRSVRYAKYLLLSNSSFAIFPAWLNKRATVIAPKYWGRRNKGFWHCVYNQYPNWIYL